MGKEDEMDNKIIAVDVSNLMKHYSFWSGFYLYDRFMEFMRQGRRSGQPIPEIVETWNSYANRPDHHVWCLF